MFALGAGATPPAPRRSGCPAGPHARPVHARPVDDGLLADTQAVRVTHPRPPSPTFDCFYVYPTVSDQPTTLSNRQIDPEERSIALYQAARYSQDCRVFAPMYRQVTVPALESGDTKKPAQLRVPIGDVPSAFETTCTRQPRPPVRADRPLAGVVVLEQLIAKEIDRNPSAVADGVGDPAGRQRARQARPESGARSGTSPACRTATGLGCVIAFSTFDQPAPANSLFGRTTVAGEQVLCVNPVACWGGAVVDPIFPSAPFAPGTMIAGGIGLLGTHPAPIHRPSGQPACRLQRALLECRGRKRAPDHRANRSQGPEPSPNPTWGLHLVDANVELGDLVSVTDAQANNWLDMRYGH